MMAMMMTGRVLLVCALCVLWCGIGVGFANEVVEASVHGAGSAGGKDMVKTIEPRTPVQDDLDTPIDLPNVDQSKGTSAGKPLEINGDNGDQLVVGTGVRDEKNKNSSEELKGAVKVVPVKGEGKELQLKNEERDGRQSQQPEVHVPLQPQSQSQQMQPPTAPQPKPSVPEEGKGVDGKNTGGDGRPSLGGENVGKETSEAVRKEVPLKDPDTQTENSEQVQTKLPNTVTPVHKNQNEMLSLEQKRNESQRTNASTNIPELQKEDKEYPAFAEGTADNASIGTQIKDGESSTSEEPSPLEQEQSTGTKTTVVAQTSDATAKEYRQTGDNEKTGDSDSSTAVSHTTSPLLLLLLVVACAVAVVAA
ncbi:mucin-associated surface protein (MASP), putative [Trypanosoma cruzi marinkellei]|uniref:Mucin-associated surface protein (MASP), putative n=1 Tax=Trypanosoma cruzi marinkellei TaxID=85056 RepID=K2MVC8_TRYCR|nr:mucin-associated surface protein (MASP), putative [Trypanosoma cruzi marinkellei]